MRRRGRLGDLLALRHQGGDLRARHGSAQVGERPARLEDDGLVIVDVVHQEHAASEPGQDLLGPGPIEARAGGCGGPLQALHHPRLVALGLQSPQEPGARVREALVVEVHGVLRRQHHAESVGAGLLEQCQHRQLRGRIRRGREVAEDLVHVEERAQAAGAGLLAHPGDHLVQQHRHEEHALLVGEVCDGEDRDPRLPLRCVEQAAHVERLALAPGGEGRRGQQIVEDHRQLEAVLRREERLEVQHAELLEGGALDRADQRGEIEVAPLAPGAIEERREQDVLAAADRIRLDPQQGQQPRHRREGALAKRLLVTGHLGRGCGERAQHAERNPRAAARGVDGEVGRIAEAGDALTRLTPLRQTFPPQLRRPAGVLFGRAAGPRRLCRVHPGEEVRGTQLGKVQQQVPQVAFRIDGDGGDAVEGGLFEQRDAEPRLAAARHADADGVRGQVLRVVEQVLVTDAGFLQVVDASEIEGPELLVIRHPVPPPAGSPSSDLLGRNESSGPARRSWPHFGLAAGSPAQWSFSWFNSSARSSAKSDGSTPRSCRTRSVSSPSRSTSPSSITCSSVSSVSFSECCPSGER